MADTNTLCRSFVKELLSGMHDFSAHTFRIALFENMQSLGKNTTTYSSRDEVRGTGYMRGGQSLVVMGPEYKAGGFYVTFEKVTWQKSRFSARGALIYNKSQAGKAVCVLGFGGIRSSDNGPFTVDFLNESGGNGFIRLEIPA